MHTFEVFWCDDPPEFLHLKGIYGNISYEISYMRFASEQCGVLAWGGGLGGDTDETTTEAG